MKLLSFSKIELKHPVLAPASRLYHLKPIGIGTPFIESLSSFTARLAQAHCVTAGVLVRSEIEEQMGKPYLRLRERYGSRASGGSLRYAYDERNGYLNGAGEVTKEWVQALEKLCGHTDLSLLTMLHWAEVLPARFLTRSKRAWCPDCYKDQSSSVNGFYDPLLWSLHPVTVCIVHRRPLCSACPECGHDLGVFRQRLRPGFCSKCDCWLGKASDQTPNEQWTTSDVTRHMRFAVLLGQLLATAPHTPRPSRESIVTTMCSLIQKLADGNSAAFARRLGRNRSVIFGWQRGKNKIPINDLLEICDHLGISLIDFFTGNTGAATADHEIRSRARTTIARRKLNWDEIRSQLELVIKQGERVSFTTVAARVGCERRSIRGHFPDLCRTICAQWSDHLKRVRAERRLQISVVIRNLALKLVDEGIYPSRRKIQSRMDIAVHTSLLTAELRSVHLELGLTQLHTNLRKPSVESAQGSNAISKA